MDKVLHIMSGFGGGISSFILNKAKEFSYRSTVFDVLTYDECGIEFTQAIEKTGGRIIQMPNPKDGEWKQFYSIVNTTMKNLPKDALVHCHIQGYRSFPFRLIAAKNGLNRFAIHAHTNNGPLKDQSMINKIDFIFNRYFSSEKVSCGIKASKSLFGEKPVKNNIIMHIPNSINQNTYFKSLCALQKEQLTSEVFGRENKDKILIGHIGRFHPLKNHVFMLDIIEELSKKGIDFQWIFFGSGELEDKVKDEVKKRNLSDYVIFYGRSNQINNMLEIMDIFVLPSFQEGLPTVAVEAQAKGTPTLLSNTISNECDMGLGLIQFLPIDDNGVNEWCEHIENLGKKEDVPSAEERRRKLSEKKFTNEAAASLYEDYINGEISHYTL